MFDSPGKFPGGLRLTPDLAVPAPLVTTLCADMYAAIRLVVPTAHCTALGLVCCESTDALAGIFYVWNPTEICSTNT